MKRFYLCLLAMACCSCQARAGTIELESVLIKLIDEVDVPARALGALDAVHVTEGTLVEQGQLLAQIDDTDARLDRQLAQFEVEIAKHHAANDVAIRSAKKLLDFAQADYKRLIRAEQDQPRSVSESELEKARLNAEQADLQLERARSELAVARLEANVAVSHFELAERNVEIRTITAPASGVVVSVLFRPGEWVTPGDKIFRIVGTDRLRAEGFVAANEVVEDLRGAKVTLAPELANRNGTKLYGRIVFVSPEIDPVNGQVRVLADVENPHGYLRPGLRASMTIATGK